MFKFLIGVVVGLVISQTGFKFADVATYMDNGVQYVKELSAKEAK